MQKELKATSGRRSTIVYVVFGTVMGGGTLFFGLLFASSISTNSYGASFVALLFLFAGAWQTFRIAQNLRYRKGIITITESHVSWEYNQAIHKVPLEDVYELSSWCGYTTLKSKSGKRLLSFPEVQDNYDEVLGTLKNMIENKHNKSAHTTPASAPR